MSDHKLCNLSEIEDGNSAAFTVDFHGKLNMVFAVRNGERVAVYLNSCPHTGAPLDLNAGKFLNLEKKKLFVPLMVRYSRLKTGTAFPDPADLLLWRRCQ